MFFKGFFGCEYLLYLDSVKMQEEGIDFLDALWCGDVAGVSRHLHVNRHLEVVLLLTHKRVVRLGEVKPFVSVHTEVWLRPGKSETNCRNHA